MNKIAILGAHGSGKSTLIKKIHETYAEKSLTVTDTARVCPKTVGKESNTDAQLWILEHQLRIEALLDGKDMPVIFDNCSLGHLAYFHFWGGDVSRFQKQIVDSMSRFDRVFLVPPNENFLFDDGLRPTDAGFQMKIFQCQLQILIDWKINYILHDPMDAFSIDKFILRTDDQIPIEVERVICAVYKDNCYLVIGNQDDISKKMALPLASVFSGESQGHACARDILAQTGYLISAPDISFSEKDGFSLAQCQLVKPIRFTSLENVQPYVEDWLPKDKFENITKTTNH